jgi:N-acyl homoserine lactone hydrolase
MHRLAFFNRFLFFIAFALISGSLHAEDSFRFSVIKTANSAGSLEAMVVAGGRFTHVRKLVHVAVLVEHPDGRFLWDTGLGGELESQMESFNFMDRQLFKIENHIPARQQLQETGFDLATIDMIIPSHMHWDHVSGLEDFVPTPVWVQSGSLEEANAGEPPGFVKSQFDSPEIIWDFITLDDGAYEGFASSKDIYGDGRVVLVNTPGHSIGHLGLFLNFSPEERYFFIGDTAWVHPGIVSNSSRPWIVKALVGVDQNFEQNARTLEHMHELYKSNKSIQFIPAHDEQILATLPIFPEYRRANWP